jgi:hypothetical protein
MKVASAVPVASVMSSPAAVQYTETAGNFIFMTLWILIVHFIEYLMFLFFLYWE